MAVTSKPTVTADDVKRLAALARVRLTPAEASEFASDLSAILNHFARIQHLKTDTVPPLSDVMGTTNVTRPDEPQALCPPKELLDRAPETHRDHVKVHAVFE